MKPPIPHTKGMSEERSVFVSMRQASTNRQEKCAAFRELAFFELPAEIRVMIYLILLKGPSGPLEIEGPLEGSDSVKTNFWPIDFKPLYACKQLYQEESEVFFKENCFAFTMDTTNFPGSRFTLPQCFPSAFDWCRITALALYIDFAASYPTAEWCLDWSALGDMLKLVTLDAHILGHEVGGKAPRLYGVMAEIIQYVRPERSTDLGLGCGRSALGRGLGSTSVAGCESAAFAGNWHYDRPD